jgi:hypothetical protein
VAALAPPEPAPGVGLLTSLPRDLWARHYPGLAATGTNLEALRAIQTSLFTLSLDPEASGVAAHDAGSRAALLSLHGGGSGHAGANRWFDKCIQVKSWC